jgi:hypothetical protein
MIVVYVHGNGNKVRADLLKRQWDQALFGRDAGDGSRMAYWAPLLHTEPLPDPEFDEIELPGGLAPEPAEALVAETVAEAPAQGELESYAREMAYTAEAVVEGEQQAPDESGAEVLPLPRAARLRIFEQLVKVTFNDVHAYFFRDYAERMRAVVRSAIAGIDEPFVVISHSLGTIIAYDVLREEASRSLQVPLLVTLGSPLGVREVQDLVAQPLQVPAGVGAWLNASDARDVVALDHTLRPEYAPPDSITDALVVNTSANHHGIREYLAAAAVRDPVLAILAGAQPESAQAESVSPAQEEQLNREHGGLLTDLGPTLRYDSRERYFADSAATFVENRFTAGPMANYHTRLLRSDGSVVASADGTLRLGFLGAGTYKDGRKVQDGDRLDGGPEPVADSRRRHAEDGADIIYGRVAPRRGGGIWLQYWLFYFNSAKGIPGIQSADGLLGAGLHQGDWELVQLGIPKAGLGSPEPVPDVAVLAAHDYAHKIAWKEVDREPDGSWAVYVGRGSHASFPKAGRWKGKKRGPFSFDVLDDFADGVGARRRPVVQAIRIGEPAWVGWPGAWGATKSKPIVGGGSPLGPWRQRPWGDPDALAADAKPWRENHVPAQELAAAPVPPPAVSVGRDGRDWTITIAMPEGTEESWAGTLTLASNGGSDAGPVLRVYDVSRPGPAPSIGDDGEDGA